MAKDEHIHVRCDGQRKEDYGQLAENLGYDNLSAFITALLESMRDRYLDGEWKSQLLHLSDDRIVAAEAHEVDGLPMGTAAFPVVAPARFWRHVREVTASSASEDGSP